MDKNYYQILCLDKSASKEEIKEAFKKAAILYHPDKNQGSKTAEEKFKLVNEAYQVLSDQHKKYVFDQKIYAQTAVMQPVDYNYSYRFQTSYDFMGHFGNESPVAKPKHNKEWSGVLFLITLLFVVLTGFVLYFLR
jgi:molecular chaperone DnaJ